LIVRRFCLTAVKALKDIAENPASYSCALLDKIADVYDVNNKNNDEMVFTLASTRGGAMSGATALHFIFAGPRSLGIMTGKSPCTVGWVASFSKNLYDLYEAEYRSVSDQYQISIGSTLKLGF
jgi:hypothetical protein